MADKVGFLVILRAVCCLLIIYGHLIADQNPQWFVVPLINRYLTDPLGVLSNLGFLAVGIFFLISGFIITHVAQRETRTDFVIKRVFRIFPPFLVVVVFLAALGRICNVPEIAAMSGADVLREASLFDSSFELVGPSWTLVIEVMFYALAAVLLPMFRSRPFAITAIVAMVPIIDRLMLSDAIAASGVGQFKVLLDFQNYLSVFAIGMAIYYAWSGKLTVRKAVLLGAMAWCALVWTMPQAADGTGVPINIFYATVVFVAVLWAGPKPRPGTAIVWVSEASYSLYLLHLALGWLVLHSMRPVLGFTAATLVSAVVIAVTAWVSYNFVELPSQRAARWLIRRLDPQIARDRATLRAS